MLSQKMLELGTKSSVIREIFEYAKKRRAEIGDDKVFDFSIGNPSIPAPQSVTDAIRRLCEEKDVGFICMKALAGGLITRSDVAYAFLAKYPVAPIWGIQRESELDEFLSYNEAPPTMTNEIKQYIENERKELAGGSK